MTQNKTIPIALIGYSGHAYVAYDIFASGQQQVIAYCDLQEKAYNPFNLHYLGPENQASTLKKLTRYAYFIAIGDNRMRKKIYAYLCTSLFAPINAIHPSAIVSNTVNLGNGTMIGARAVINPLCSLSNGVICNTACVVEHECTLGNFVHIAPNATLCGNVSIGDGTFVGANAVIKQGITIGKNVCIGAGCVVLKDIPDGHTVVGNPQRRL